MMSADVLDRDRLIVNVFDVRMGKQGCMRDRAQVRFRR
jgi:hypothetical protein